MTDRRSGMNKAAMGMVLAAFLPGCGEEALPYDALPLRDTLQATPEVIAGLPLESRRELARRFEESQSSEHEATTIQPPREQAIEDIAWAADAIREAHDQDALILGAVAAKEDTFVVDARNIANDTPNNAPEVRLHLQGPRNAVTADFYPRTPTVIVGPTGAGQTTNLRTITGLWQARHGHQRF